jgi:hypothetical protein
MGYGTKIMDIKIRKWLQAFVSSNKLKMLFSCLNQPEFQECEFPIDLLPQEIICKIAVLSSLIVNK